MEAGGGNDLDETKRGATNKGLKMGEAIQIM